MAESFAQACEIQSILREHQRILSDAVSSSEFAERLERSFEVFMKKSVENCFEQDNIKTHYSRFIESLLRPPILGFYATLDSDCRSKFEAFFLQGNASESFLVLGNALSNTEHVKLVATLLEKFLGASRLSDVLIEQCLDHSTMLLQGKKPAFLRSQILTMIVSLPERVANKFRLVSPKSVYHTEIFVETVSKCIIDAMNFLHQSTDKLSSKFLSELLGRLCMAGHGRRVLAITLPVIEQWMATSPFWMKLCSELFIGIPDNTLEHVSESLLKETSDPNVIRKLFRNSITTNPRLKFLFTTKFLLLRTYSEPQVLVNIVSYLASSNTRQVLIDAGKSLFDNWSSKSILKHTPHDHHLYISCSLVHVIGHLSVEEKASLKHEFLNRLLTGVQIHLESPIEKFRHLGMVIAECVTMSLEPNVEKLAFDYIDNEESKLIKEFAKGPNALFKKRKSHNKQARKHLDALTGSSSNAAASEEMPRQNDEGNDESDDEDLVAYDMEDEDLERSSHPKHLRDCMEGLLEREKPEKTEAALKAIEKVVCTEPDDLGDVCIELVKILLHLQDQYSTENFLQLRHDSMVAIATRCPVEIACYLTEEFFSANYNISQRLDMLNVLQSTAQILSEPKEISKEKSVPKKFPLPKIEDYISVRATPEWQRIIDDRIEGRTRRFVKGPSRPPPTPVANKFSKVAGHFFYPLMKNFDCKHNTLDLIGEDCFLLGRLIHTLGVMMYSARGTPGARTMGAALLEFTWALRYHPEPYIRQVLVFAQIMVVISVPAPVLLGDCSSELFEIQFWLKELVMKDANSEVKQIGAQAIAVLEETFRNEVAGSVG